MDHQGNFTIAWMDSLQDGSLSGVYAQRYDASANRVGGEFRGNSTTYYTQYQPAIDYDGLGSFVIVWTNVSLDSRVADIYGQRFDSAGEMVGGEFQVNTYVEQNQSESDIAVRDDGSFIVGRESTDQDGSGLVSTHSSLMPMAYRWGVNSVSIHIQQTINRIPQLLLMLPAMWLWGGPASTTAILIFTPNAMTRN